MRFRPTILLCGTLVLSCALAALIVSSTEAQDKTYTFTKQMKAGDKWTVNTTLRSDMDFVVKDVHGDRDKFSVSAERTETYSSECVEMQSGEISKRRLQYSVSDELVSRSPGEGGEKKKTALSGKSIDVETGQDGTKVTCVEGEIPADATAGLRAEEDYALLLPKKAVKESDTWELESEDAGNFAFGLDKKIVTPRNIGVKCILREVTRQGSRDIARIEIEGKLDGTTPDGYSGQLELTGELLYCMDAGLPVSMWLKASLKVSGKHKGEHEEVLADIAGDGSVKLTVTYGTPLDSGK
jgi:hypothetical protein